ncbi:Integrase core domain protein [Corynebacterium faecale]|nr:Integrase core domain protein [Corynebacterium faecale]
MIRFQFVDDAQKNHSVKRICEVLKLNRSSYYKWKNSSSTRRKRLISDVMLGARVKTVFTAENGCYGAKRITAELKDQIGHDPVNHKRVARIMRSLKLFGYDRRNARSPPPCPIRRNQCSLIWWYVKFTADKPNQVYVGDITYLPIADGSNMYLATVIDCYSRRLVGFSCQQITCVLPWCRTLCSWLRASAEA